MSDFTTVKLDRDVHKEAKDYCYKNGMTLSGLVRKLLLEQIKAAQTEHDTKQNSAGG